MSVGQRIKEGRKKLGLSQVALGKRLGVDQSTVALWETERTIPRDEVMQALADVLFVTPQYIRYGSEVSERDVRVGSGGVPSVLELAKFVFEYLKNNGGYVPADDLPSLTIEGMGISNDVLDVVYLDGVQSKFNHRLNSAIEHMIRSGVLVKSNSGVIYLDQKSSSLNIVEFLSIFGIVSDELSGPSPSFSDDGGDENERRLVDVLDWRQRLLTKIKMMSPQAFEHLCKMVLAECGFREISVTGRSGDGGIDGTAVLKSNLLSYPVVFQCKRYAGSVGSPEVRNFRGAMDGRTDKGILITTGNFTKDAEIEARRAGAIRVELINGNEFCEIMKEKKFLLE